jgi:hypothetical protein
MLSVYEVLLIVNPIWATLLALVVLTCLLSWTGLWKRYGYWILAGALALYAIDAVIALRRVAFSYGLPDHPIVAQKIPLPRQLVLVNVLCSAECHRMLISGAVDDIVLVRLRSSRAEKETQPVRFRAGWSIPGTCPFERQRAIGYPGGALLQMGYCPLVEPADIPSQGIFLIQESAIVSASERARSFTPTYLTKGPPGSVIQFAGVEVQVRSPSGTKVLASTYSYHAPGFLGLPPLIGCWNRPDNVIWVMPPGDTGCGFWRWFTRGGDATALDPKWLFDNAFEPPDRVVVPPARPVLSPPAPAEALEILANAPPVDDYLPGLRDQVLDPANTDQALANFVARLALRERLEGSLVALLAANRPAALVGLAALLKPAPLYFVKSDAVVAEMENNPKFRDQFADTMFLMLAANWHPQETVERFLTLMERSHPGWLCNQLGHLNGPDGILMAREDRTKKNGIEAMPPFVPLILRKTAQTCPDQTLEILRDFLSAPLPERRTEAADLVARNAPNLAPQLAAQAVVNLTENVSDSSRYFEMHLWLLRAAGHSCDMVAANIEAYISRESQQRRVASPIAIQNLKRVREETANWRCR